MARIATIGIVLVLALPMAAAAQLDLEVPDPPGASSGESISDDELIRWASNEVRIHEGRAPAPPRAPVPPVSYLGTGIDGPVVMPNQGERDAVRVLAELGGGALGVLIGGGLGALAVWAAIEGDANPDWMMVTVAAATTLGAFGVTGGVVLAGDAAGGQGNFGHAFIGQLIGSAAALPLVTLGMANDAPALAVVAASVLPLAGAFLGYEISHANRQSAFVRPTPGGVVGGVAGPIP